MICLLIEEKNFCMFLEFLLLARVQVVLLAGNNTLRYTMTQRHPCRNQVLPESRHCPPSSHLQITVEGTQG